MPVVVSVSPLKKVVPSCANKVLQNMLDANYWQGTDGGDAVFIPKEKEDSANALGLERAAANPLCDHRDH